MGLAFIGNRRVGNRSITRPALLVAALVLLYVVFQFLSMRNDMTLARHSLERAKVAVRGQDTDAADDLLDAAASHIGDARRRAGAFPLNVLAHVPVIGSPIAAMHDGADAGTHVVAAGRMIGHTAAAFPTSGEADVNGHDLSSFHDAAERSKVSLHEAASQLARADDDLAGPSGAWLPLLSSAARGLRAQVADTRHDLQGARRALDLLADFTAPATDARLLVLNQDSLELRATGGFIGSFGVLHFAHGTVTLERSESFEALPPPNPPMEPPKYLAGALPRFWGLSNVNWWPDFPTTAATAKEMFKRQAGGDIDGVIALNEDVLGRLIGVLGPVQLPGYAKPVVEEGFEDRVVYEVELKRPQDNPRKKFLTELSKVVFDRLFSLPAAKVSGVANVLDASVGRGDVQVWFADSAREAKVMGTAWSGQLPRPQGDFLMVVDSNLEASKSNGDLTRQVTYHVHRERDDYLADLDVRYRNEGEATSINPGYHGFVRVYAPKGARLTASSGTKGDLGPAPDGPFRVFGAYVDVPPEGGERLVSLQYTLPHEEVAAGGTYRLTWERQSGTPNDELVAVLGGRTIDADPSQRMLRAEHDLAGNPVMDFLRRRRLTRWLTGS